jgi:hypothetical protein
VCVPPLVKDRTVSGGDANAVWAEAQAAPEGVSFAAGVTVSADRRYVHLKIAEKVTEIDVLPKPIALPRKKPGADVQEQVAELLDALRRGGPLEPVLSESAHSHETDVPDGGSVFMAVQVRPRTLEAAERWWVLVVSPRILIKEEERALRETFLNTSLRPLLSEILTNPRLKTTRALYGSPDDQRWAALSSDAWAWPSIEPPLAIPDHPQIPATGKGKRLLGIRIDDFQWSGKANRDLAITVTLRNAGGDDNGAAPGSCRLRFVARPRDKEKTPTIELLD